MTFVLKMITCLVLLSYGLFAAAAFPSADSLIAQATKENKDILIYYHGSDWSPIGETLLKTLWKDLKLQKGLSSNFVMAQCDIREQQSLIDLAAFAPIASDELPGVETSFDIPIASSGADFKISNQQTFLVSGRSSKNDRYTLSFTPKKEILSPVFRIRLIQNPSLPNDGPSRSADGKCALSYVTLTSGALEKIPFVDAIADVSFKDKLAKEVLNENKDHQKFWGFETKAKPNGATLYLVAGQSLKANETYQLVFYFNSQWTSSAFGCFKVNVFDSPEVIENIAQVSEYYAQAAAMAPFRNVNEGFPLIRAFDKEKRELGTMACLTDKTSIEQVSDFFDKISKARMSRDRFFERAKTQKGADKAQLLASALLSFDPILSYGKIRSIYKPQYDEIRRLDPEDTGAYQRKIDLPYNTIVSTIRSFVNKGDYKQAETYYQAQLNDPKNFRLTKDQRQSLTFAGFYLYKNWKENEEKKWRLLETVADINPTSHIGLGVRGYLSMNGRGEIAVPYGVFPKDLSGTFLETDISMGVAKIINHKGTYTLTFEYKNGKNNFDIQSVSVLVNEKSCFLDHNIVTLSKDNRSKTYDFEIPFNIMPSDNVVISLKATAPNGNDCYIGIEIKPTLE